MSNARYEGGASIIFYVGDQVLLQKRTTDAPIWPSRWGTFGGHIEDGETPDQAAVREIGEELGIDVDPGSIETLCEFPIEIIDIPGDLYFFTAPLPVELDQIKLMEGAGFGLFSEDEIEGLSMIPGAKRAVRRLFSTKKADGKMTGAA